MSEIFPGKVRGLAASVTTLLNWTLSFTVTETFVIPLVYLAVQLSSLLTCVSMRVHEAWITHLAASRAHFLAQV